MAKKKLVSPERLDAVINSFEDKRKPRQAMVEVGDVGCNLTVKPYLNAEEIVGFIEGVASSVLHEGKYYPYLKDYFIRLFTLDAYTSITIPDEIEKCWTLVYGTPLYYKVTACEDAPVTWGNREYNIGYIDQEQYKSILKGIDDKIAFEVKKMELGSIVDHLFSKVKDATDEISKIDFSGLLNALSDIGKQGENVSQ